MSSASGESYSTMCRKISDKGPSLILIRDTKGHVFGGFASQAWTFGSRFVGLYDAVDACCLSQTVRISLS